MGKEIGDFAGGLAQGATGGFQQLMQQQMQQRQFQEQREFAREQQQSQNAFTSGENRAAEGARIALFEKREDAARDRQLDNQQFAIEQAEIKLEGDDERHGEIVGLKKQSLSNAAEEKASTIAFRNKQLTESKRQFDVDMEAGKVRDATKRFDVLGQEYRETLRQLELPLETQNRLARQHNNAFRAQIVMKVFEGSGTEALSKYIAAGGTEAGFKKATATLQRLGDISIQAAYLPEQERGELMTLGEAAIARSQAANDQVVAAGGSPLEGMVAATNVLSDALNEVPELQKESRSLLKKKESDKATAAKKEAIEGPLREKEKRDAEMERSNLEHRLQLGQILGQRPPTSTLIGGRR